MNTNKRSLMLAASVALVFSVAQAGVAQKQSAGDLRSLKKEIETIRENQTSIQKELQEIKALLRIVAQARPAEGKAQNALLNVHGLPSKGEQEAPVTIVEFSDYKCPFCGNHVRETWPQIDNQYVKTGKIRYVFADLPLESLHPQALKAAEASHCAGDQGKFWEMHDQLFSNQRALGLQELSLHAQAVGLNMPTFQQCLFTDKHTSRIRRSMAVAETMGISGTPTFLVAVKGPKSSMEVRVVKPLSGAQPFAAFKSVIDSLLASENKAGTR